jgi:hypothetical protein
MEDCRAVPILHAESGAPIEGAEDFALMDDGSIVLSAYDRASAKTGGLHRLEAEALKGEPEALRAAPLAEGIKPHGIATSGSEVLAIIRSNRGVTVEAFAAKGDGRRTVREGPELCSANDLTGLYVTLERTECRRSLGRAFAGKSGRVIELASGREVLTGLHLPNGIAEHEGQTFVAEMRRRRIVSLDGEGAALPGAPDNLHATGEGIVAAVQPSLPVFGLYRFGLRDRAPARVVLHDPKTRETELLWDDPHGRLVPGLTAASLVGGRLFATSVRGHRALLCHQADA